MVRRNDAFLRGTHRRKAWSPTRQTTFFNGLINRSPNSVSC